jgi:hypothetical protein
VRAQRKPEQLRDQQHALALDLEDAGEQSLRMEDADQQVGRQQHEDTGAQREEQADARSVADRSGQAEQTEHDDRRPAPLEQAHLHQPVREILEREAAHAEILGQPVAREHRDQIEGGQTAAEGEGRGEAQRARARNHA